MAGKTLQRNAIQLSAKYTGLIVRKQITDDTFNLNLNKALTKTWYWLGVCHGRLHSYELRRAVKNAQASENYKMKKYCQ